MVKMHAILHDRLVCGVISLALHIFFLAKFKISMESW